MRKIVKVRRWEHRKSFSRVCRWQLNERRITYLIDGLASSAEHRAASQPEGSARGPFAASATAKHNVEEQCFAARVHPAAVRVALDGVGRLEGLDRQSEKNMCVEYAADMCAVSPCGTVSLVELA